MWVRSFVRFIRSTCCFSLFSCRFCRCCDKGQKSPLFVPFTALRSFHYHLMHSNSLCAAHKQQRRRRQRQRQQTTAATGTSVCERGSRPQAVGAASLQPQPKELELTAAKHKQSHYCRSAASGGSKFGRTAAASGAKCRVTELKWLHTKSSANGAPTRLILVR